MPEHPAPALVTALLPPIGDIALPGLVVRLAPGDAGWCRAVTGEIDHAGAPALERALTAALRSRPPGWRSS
ncbi:hypothetical protein [Kitasatospora sp. McL0602]|uniref:hypothetical protein n=1 Tax=Kitasatospora sp. McL0602 TaxID=3439530 RepID=UPI003F8B40B4